MDSTYKGYEILTDEEIANFYTKGEIDRELFTNEYVILGDDCYCYQNNGFRRVEYPIISSQWCGQIKPRDVYQKMAIDSLADRTTKVKVIRGVYGSGETFAAI